MATASRDSDRLSTTVEILTDTDAGTVTFVADRDGDETETPTEWITVATGDVIDVKAHR
jgi:hypothetical protein